MTGSADLDLSMLDRFRDDLVGLKMPRALEALDHIVAALSKARSARWRRSTSFWLLMRLMIGFGTPRGVAECLYAVLVGANTPGDGFTVAIVDIAPPIAPDPRPLSPSAAYTRQAETPLPQRAAHGRHLSHRRGRPQCREQGHCSPNRRLNLMTERAIAATD